MTRDVWLVFKLYGCGEETCERDVLGAFAREEDAVGYGVWLLGNDKVKAPHKIEITRLPLAPPGSMYPPETVH